jgi:hypothetical protein
MHSYVLFCLQAATLMPPIFQRVRYVKNVFQPSVFVLVYFLVNFAVGSFLVPREYGWNKEFSRIAFGTHYNAIIPYFILVNLVVFLIAIRGLERIGRDEANWIARVSKESLPITGGELGQSAMFFTAFLCISALDVYSSFSFEMAIMIIHLTMMNMKRDRTRFFAYVFYLAVLTTFQAENKREIIMALFLMTLIESYFTQFRFHRCLGGILLHCGNGIHSARLWRLSCQRFV